MRTRANGFKAEKLTDKIFLTAATRLISPLSMHEGRPRRHGVQDAFAAMASEAIDAARQKFRDAGLTDAKLDVTGRWNQARDAFDAFKKKYGKGGPNEQGMAVATLDARNAALQFGRKSEAEKLLAEIRDNTRPIRTEGAGFRWSR